MPTWTKVAVGFVCVAILTGGVVLALSRDDGDTRTRRFEQVAEFEGTGDLRTETFEPTGPSFLRWRIGDGAVDVSVIDADDQVVQELSLEGEGREQVRATCPCSLDIASEGTRWGVRVYERRSP